MGFEPTTFCMASRRSSQLSYSRAVADSSFATRKARRPCRAVSRIRGPWGGLQVALAVAAEGAVVASGLLSVRSTAEIVGDVTLVVKRAECAGTSARVALRT